MINFNCHKTQKGVECIYNVMSNVNTVFIYSGSFENSRLLSLIDKSLLF